MAQPEPMDVDCMEGDFDNKENTFHHNVPCTEKGYEELDVSELNMKLRFSMTPTSSPMSKSYTARPDSHCETGDTLNCNSSNANLSRSLNSAMTKNDNVIKSLKSLPLQSLGTEQFVDRNSSICRQQVSENANITVPISGINEIDENLSLPSSSSSTLHTPEATTPTKEIKEEVSPILRGLKSMLNIFRSSTSPVPQAEIYSVIVKQEVLSPENSTVSENSKQQAVASTPIATHQTKDNNSTKRSSPYKDSIVFNEEMEKELNWNEKTVTNSEKNMIPKLQNSRTIKCKASEENLDNSNMENDHNSIAEYANLSNNGSMIQDGTMTECHPKTHDITFAVESDGEFLDCETTFSKNESYVLDIKGVQEKMSAKINPNETSHMLGTPKSAEFLDCDSTISNESYVLDFKEIHEKVSAKLNLDQTHHMSLTSENVPNVNQTVNENATSMSFADLDLKLDTTMPSDYHDYSQATAEILKDLDKLETKETDVYKQTNVNENITVQKDVTAQHVRTSELVLQNVTQDNNTLEQNNQNTESQETQLNITAIMCDNLDTTLTEKESVNTSLSVDYKIIHDPEIQISLVHFTESPVESENENIVQVDNSNGGCEVNVLSFSNTINADQTVEATMVQVNSISENIIPSTETKAKEYTETPVEISNNSVEKVLSEKSHVIQNDVIPVEVINSLQNDDPSEALSVTLNDVIPNLFPENNTILPVDLPSKEKNIVVVIQNINAIQTPEYVQVTENPSDIPLPADDFEEKSATNEVLITPVEKVLACSSNTIITSPKSAAIDAFPAAAEAFAENICKNDSILATSLVAQLSERETQNNTNSNASDLTLKTLSENQINSNLGLLDHSPLKTDGKFLTKPFVMITSESNSAGNDSNEKNPDNVLTNKINHNTTSELLTSSVTTFGNDTNVANVTEQSDDFHESPNNLYNNNVIIDNLGHYQNTSDLEPMDITLNETLNLTHELPDLVNQTILLAEHNVQNQNSSNNTVIEPIQIKFPPNLSHIIKDNNLPHENTSEIIKCMPDFETKIASAEIISENESIIKVTEEKATNLDVDVNKRPVSEIENTKSVHMNISVVSSDDQPPKVFTNTSDPEPMEIEEPTVDEEIIVSASNSPYVSYMSDVKYVSENIEKYKETEIVSKEAKLEEPKEIGENDNTKKLGNIEETNTIEKSEKNENPDNNKEQKRMDNPFKEIENPCAPESNVVSSPPITSKGYNFNFDEIDDPFATKTKIRLSPSPNTPTKKEAEDNNDEQFKVQNKGLSIRRKSQPLVKKKSAVNKKFNASFDIKIMTNKMQKDEANANQITEYKTCEENFNEISDRKEINEEGQGDIKAPNTSGNFLKTSDKSKLAVGLCDAILSDLKSTSSSEQSTYYSAGTSSSESIYSKNVFNLPEIDDVNFNPFATKSKIRQSPTPDKEIEDPFATRPKMRQSPPPLKEIDNHFATKSKMRSSSEVSIFRHSNTDTDRTITLDESKLAQLTKNIEDGDKMNTELMEKDTSVNIADSTSSSRATDNQNLTTHEVNTEDEDTIEGPFFDVGDVTEKITDITGEDNEMMFNDPQKAPQALANADNLDGELFIDAEAFEFLLNQNKDNIVADSGKESLFLKFDPLFAKRISTDGLFASLNKVQKRQSTPTKPTRPSLRKEVSPVAGSATTPTKPARPLLHNEISTLAGPSTMNVTYECDGNISQESNEDANITVTKPMMVVNPALNPTVTPRNKSVTPVRLNRHSITVTSPAIAVIDRILFSMSANNSTLGHDSSITSALSNGEQTEAELTLTHLRELLAKKEISVNNLRNESEELKDRLTNMESQVRVLEADGQKKLKKLNEQNERLTEMMKANKSMAAVVEEYERTIAALIADIEQNKKLNAEERIRLINERDEQTAHLRSMEVSFIDLNSKYEKCKQIVLACKANEDIQIKSNQGFQEQVAKLQTNYEMLKQHATAKLNHANQELERINKAHEAEVLKLNSIIKKHQVLATSLQESIAQKTKANDELTAICDELINKVSSK